MVVSAKLTLAKRKELYRVCGGSRIYQLVSPQFLSHEIDQVKNIQEQLFYIYMETGSGKLRKAFAKQHRSMMFDFKQV